MKKSVFFIIILIFSSINAIIAQDNRPKIKEYVDHQIIMCDSWAGQSFTLKKENRDFYIQRDIFGSGVPVIATVKYKVVFNSKYQIQFSEVIDTTKEINDEKCCEHFVFGVGNDGLELYLNGFKLIIKNSCIPVN